MPRTRRHITPAAADELVTESCRNLAADADIHLYAAEALRDELVDELDGIVAEAEAEGRSALHASEQRSYDTITDALKRLERSLGPIHARMRSDFDRLRSDTAQRRDRAAHVPQRGRAGGDDASIRGRSYSSPAEARDAALAMIDERSDELDPTAAQRVADDLRRVGRAHSDVSGAELVLATGDAAYRSAFDKLVRDPARGHMEFDQDEQRAFARAQTVARAINVGTNAQGGFLVPLTLDPAIMLTNDGVIDPMRQISRVVTTTTDHWKGITSAGVSAEYAAEAAEVADATPTDLAQPTVNVHRGDATVEVTLEAAMDTDFVNQLGELLGDAKRVIEGEKFWAGAGDGSNEPEGVITGLDGTSSEVAPLTAETFAVGDVYNLLEQVPARFRRKDRCAWVGKLGTYNTIRQFADDEGHALLARLADGDIEQLLGRRAYEASEADDAGDINPAATGDNHVLVCGSFRDGYVIADRLGSMLTLTDGLGANRRPTGTRWYTLWWRNGGKVVNASALRVLNVATTA